MPQMDGIQLSNFVKQNSHETDIIAIILQPQFLSSSKTSRIFRARSFIIIGFNKKPLMPSDAAFSLDMVSENPVQSNTGKSGRILVSSTDSLSPDIFGIAIAVGQNVHQIRISRVCPHFHLFGKQGVQHGFDIRTQAIVAC